jgi:thiol-disulfide isomerase/thioredoxin
MIEYISLIIAVIVVSISGLIAQEAPPAKQPVIDLEKLEVRDSAGRLLKMDEWLPMNASGKYNLTFNPEYTRANITKLSAEAYLQKMKATPKPGESKSFVTGTFPANFKEKTIRGNRIELDKLKGKVVVLNFWFVGCPPCRMEIPELNELTKEFAGREVVFVGVALDEKAAVEEFLVSTPFDYQQIASGRAIATQYGIKGYPTHAVLDKTGKVVFQTMGLAPNTLFWLGQSIEEALAQNPGK